MNDLEMHVAQLENDCRSLNKELAEAAEWLARDMARLAEKVRLEGNDASVNSLGEAQSLPGTVNRLCALRDAKLRELTMARNLLARSKEA